MSVQDTKPACPMQEGTEEGGFLTRWSRRKRAAEAGQPLPEPAPPPEAQPPAVAADLPDPATLSFDDDFSAYLGAQVPSALKRAALAKLFADPSFNKMDGLDVYIEDYNLVPDLPAEERDLLAHASRVLSPEPTADRPGPPPTSETETTPQRALEAEPTQRANPATAPVQAPEPAPTSQPSSKP